MEHNEDRDSLKNIPTYTFPPPPRFDAAASAAARPVQPLEKTRKPSLSLGPKFSRLINRRSKFLASMAIVGLATGAAGGILVVESDKQQRLESSASMIQIPTEQPPTSDSAAPAPENTGASPALENNGASPEVSEPVENQVRVRRNQRRARKQAISEREVLSNTEEDEDEDLKRDKDNDDEEEEKDTNDDARKKNRDRERNSKDRDRDADSDRNDGSRRGAMLYDVIRSRKP